MDSLLLIVTILSVATTIVAITTLRRLQRDERQRSDARVAALAAAASDTGDGEAGWRRVAGEWQWKPDGPAAIVDRPAAQTSQDQLFDTVRREGEASGRLPFVAAAVLIALLGGALVFLKTTNQGASVTAAQHAVPLDLVSLGHTRDASALTITGTVRNPASGHTLEGLTAVVSLLDAGGGLISTKDVPLDYRALGPGEEAPFKVSVPDPSAIARYRVSFRAGTDVVPHIDRRTDAKLASTER